MQHVFIGKLFKVGRLRRGFSEFLALPLIIAVLFCCAAALLAFWDNQGTAPGVRRIVAAMIPASGATAFVGVVAASLMTITSITFTVLLIAVQQTSSFLGAVVFDQYLRRRANQVYVGYFVGATAFSFIVLACAGSGSPPVIGAFAVLVLTAGCLVALLLLIYSTVDQMRPESVVRSIHNLALRAHKSEMLLLTGTRKTRRTDPGSAARVVTARTGGYVVDIDPLALASVARSAGPDVEVFLPCLLGTYVALGESLASLVGVGADDDRFDADTLAAVTLDDSRRVEVDSGYSIDQLHNIAWTGACGQSPLVASAAIHQLRDLLAQWATAEEQTLDTSKKKGEPLPVVYTDGAIKQVLHGLGTLVLASVQTRQVDTTTLLVASFTHAVPRLGSDEHRTALTDALDAALPSIGQQASSPALTAAVADLIDVLVAESLDHRAARRLQADLGAAARAPKGHPTRRKNVQTTTSVSGRSNRRD